VKLTNKGLQTNKQQTKKELLKESRKQRKVNKIVDKESPIDATGNRVGACGTDHSDEMRRWADEDVDEDYLNEIMESHLSDLIEEHNNIPFKITGNTWYHYERRIGRIWKSVVDANIRNNTTTIFLLGDNLPVTYRLTIPKGKEDELLLFCTKQGFNITRVKLSYIEGMK